MPAGVSAKSSARTGYQFYKNSNGIIHSGKNSVVKGGGFGIPEESPPRGFGIGNFDGSNEALPSLTVKRGS